MLYHTFTCEKENKSDTLVYRTRDTRMAQEKKVKRTGLNRESKTKERPVSVERHTADE